MSEYKELNIFEKMSRITLECPPIGKSLEVEKGNGKTYRAVSETAVLEAVRSLEAKYGVYSYPVDRRRTTSTLTREFAEWGSEQRRKVNYMVDSVTTTYRFVNMDNPLEFIDMISFGTGMDTGDKGVGKAITYSDKYALIKAYKLITSDASDPDAYASPDGVSFCADVFTPGYQLPPAMPEVPAQAIPAAELTQEKESADTEKPVEEVEGAKEPEKAAESKPEKERKEKLPAPSPAPAEEPKRGRKRVEKKVEEVPKADVMTENEAKNVIIPFGSMAGKSLGELLAVNPETIRWFASSQSFNASKSNAEHPEVRIAARILSQEAAERK